MSHTHVNTHTLKNRPHKRLGQLACPKDMEMKTKTIHRDRERRMSRWGKEEIAKWRQGKWEQPLCSKMSQQPFKKTKVKEICDWVCQMLSVWPYCSISVQGCTVYCTACEQGARSNITTTLEPVNTALMLAIFGFMSFSLTMITFHANNLSQWLCAPAEMLLCKTDRPADLRSGTITPRLLYGCISSLDTL